MSSTIFFGQIVNCRSFEVLEVIPDGYLAVDSSGKICGLGESHDFAHWNHSERDNFTKHQLGKNEFLLPGFIDCHIHASQTPNIGLGLDKPLLDWLETYTFPLESEYADVEFARNVYRRVVRNCLSVGTTTACYFGTIHRAATQVLVDEAIEQGQRAFIGKVSMDQNSPHFYVESTERSLEETEAFVKYVLERNSDLVQPVITPRFAITCTGPLLEGLSRLAKKYDLLIQSHMSENLGEIEFVKSLFPRQSSYAEVYRAHGLLTNKTIMAHCVHMEDAELDLFKIAGTAAIHCPNSNTHLSSGLCDVQRIRKNEVTVGLGSDISGGNRIGIFDVIRHSLEVSKALKFVKTQEIKGTGRTVTPDESYTDLNYKNALFLATLGGAEALGVATKTGSFEIGKEFDALLVTTEDDPILNFNAKRTNLQGKSARDSLLDLVQKFVYVGDDRNISRVFVRGRQVK